jgi:hypothetical protein
MNERMNEIDRCMAELEWIRVNRHAYPAEQPGLQLGECDWLAELHSLLYEDA